MSQQINPEVKRQYYEAKAKMLEVRIIKYSVLVVVILLVSFILNRLFFS